MYRGKKIAVVVPAHNEEDLIAVTVRSVPSFVEHIIVVDDASEDRTEEVVKGMMDEFSDRLVLIPHKENKGVGGAIASGYNRALELDDEIILVMAGDAQMNPQFLPALLDPIVDGKADYTKGNRLLSSDLKKMPKKRRFGNALLTVMTKFSSGYWLIVDPQNGYTAISKKAAELVLKDGFYPRYGYCNDILIKLNAHHFRVCDVVMPPVYGMEKSGIKLPSYSRKLSKLLIKGFFWRLWNKYGRIQLNPILFFYLLGIAMSPLGILLGIYSMYVEWFKGLDITAGTSVLISLILIIGLQSLFFALLFDELASRGLQSVVYAKGVEYSDLHMKMIQGDEKVRFDIVEHRIEPAEVIDLGRRGEKVPSIRGIFGRIKREYWGTKLHPVALMYLLGFPTAAIGFIFGGLAIYSKFVHDTYSVPTMVLSSLLIIIGVQSIFFAMVYEMEISKEKKE